MKKFLKNYWLLLPISLIGSFFLRSYIVSVDESFIFDFEILAFIALIFLFFWLLSFYKSIKLFKENKNYFYFTPFVIGFLFIISFFIIKDNLEKRDVSPMILQAGYDGDYNGAWFEFREDGTYKFANSSGFGADFFRGNYRIKNDTIIILDKKNIDNTIESNLLAIRKESIFIINEKHQIIDKIFEFKIHIDKRK